MSKSTSETSDPVYVTATPVSNTSSQYENSGTSSNTDTGESVPHAYPTAQVEESRVGVCRGCGREFTRPAGVHSAQAQYYRCDKCNGWGSLLMDSCIVS
mmetsp:Transcript_26309/g.39000  ORF Transcript_26309/g.39000 Transcript_26309/m.39000 type:complete len:99 (+) Transcript_26309:160-456(+)